MVQPLELLSDSQSEPSCPFPAGPGQLQVVPLQPDWEECCSALAKKHPAAPLRFKRDAVMAKHARDQRELQALRKQKKDLTSEILEIRERLPKEWKSNLRGGLAFRNDSCRIDRLDHNCRGWG